MEEKIDKERLILENIIKEYLKNPEPIGSEQLKTKLTIKISSSTIRSYFKRLEDTGALMQIHISSGRVPTNTALKSYWIETLLPIKNLLIADTKKLKKVANEESIFFVARYINENELKEIINVKNRYLLLVFQNGEVSIEHSNALERFLNGFIGFEAKDLRDICNQVGAFNLSKRLSETILLDRFEKDGNREVVNMYSQNEITENLFLECINGDIIDRFENGLNFINDNYLSIKQDALIEKKRAKFLSIGHISRDFESFFNQVQKES